MYKTIGGGGSAQSDMVLEEISFEELVLEEILFEEFQDGRHGGHLGYPKRNNFSNSVSLTTVTVMPPIKF